MAQDLLERERRSRYAGKPVSGEEGFVNRTRSEQRQRIARIVAVAHLAAWSTGCPYDPSPRPLVCADVKDGRDLYIEGWLLEGAGEVSVTPGYGRFQDGSIQVMHVVGATVDNVDPSDGIFTLQFSSPMTTAGSFRFEAILEDDFGTMCMVERDFEFKIQGSDIEFS